MMHSFLTLATALFASSTSFLVNMQSNLIELAILVLRLSMLFKGQLVRHAALNKYSYIKFHLKLASC